MKLKIKKGISLFSREGDYKELEIACCDHIVMDLYLAIDFLSDIKLLIKTYQAYFNEDPDLIYGTHESIIAKVQMFLALEEKKVQKKVLEHIKKMTGHTFPRYSDFTKCLQDEVMEYKIEY